MAPSRRVGRVDRRQSTRPAGKAAKNTSPGIARRASCVTGLWPMMRPGAVSGDYVLRVEVRVDERTVR
eukprot:4571711-Prymnesium_polylepis.2